MVVYHYILYANICHVACLFFYLSCDCDTSKSDNNWTANFLLASPQMSVICFSNVSLFSNLTSSNFSRSLFFMSNSLTLKFTASLELTNKWHLSTLPFNKLFLNYSRKTFEAFPKYVITPLMSSAITYGELSSA